VSKDTAFYLVLFKITFQDKKTEKGMGLKRAIAHAAKAKPFDVFAFN
jgi:hypothetical protein